MYRRIRLTRAHSRLIGNVLGNLPSDLLTGLTGRRGAVAVQVALMLVALIGFMSLGSEIVLLFASGRHMQAAADSAALAAVRARIAGDSWANQQQEAYAMAAVAGFINGVAGTTITVNNPPASGHYTSDTGAIEVLIAQARATPLARVVYKAQFTVRVRSVAHISGYGDCILELDSASTTGISVTNGAAADLNQCSLAANATGTAALLVNGGATLTTTSVTLGGTASVTNGGRIINASGNSLVGTTQIQTQQPAAPNPYANVAVPTGIGCTHGSLSPDKPLTLGHSNSGLQTLYADGVYCGGLAMTNDAQVQMTAGTYIINGGSVNIGGAVQLNGAGVTIVLTGSGSDYATVTIGNGATVNLTAPTTGATSGLVFFQDPTAPNTGSDTFGGGSTVTLTGALDFPSQTMVFSNGTSTTAVCTQLIAWQIQFSGGASFNINCAGTGVLPIGGSVKLVE
jgi:hypothetical protein